MRARYQSTTLASSEKTVTDLQNGNVSHSANPTTVSSESLIWDYDGPPIGRKVTKPCTHLKYVATCFPFSVYDSGDGSNIPNPRTRYDNRIEVSYATHRPPGGALSSLQAQWIDVTSQSTDDIGKCVFNAYNKFVVGVQSLDSSVSLAESGETPKLFEIWNRRRGLPRNLVNGYLNYSFGWKPVLNDLRAIAKELRSFPSTVRKRLKQLGKGYVVRHYKFDLTDTVTDLNTVYADSHGNTYVWQNYHRELQTTSKSRSVVVTIRAKVEPKLNGEGQEILDKLGTLGLIPSLATIWSITRLSFVVDWFFNIGSAIENLQGSLTHNISDVSVCVSDSRIRYLTTSFEGLGGSGRQVTAVERQKYYSRFATTVPILPVFRLPTQPMQYVLLGLLALTTTKKGDIILASVDKYDKLTPKVAAKIISSVKSYHQSNIDALMKIK